MALLSRIKNLAKPNYSLVNILKRHYFQINNHHFQSSFSPNHQILCYRRDGFFNSSVRFFAAPAKYHKKKFEPKKVTRPRLNDEIDVDIVRLVSDEGHSVVSRMVALQRAAELKCDLVEVHPDAKPPVCKIMDYKLEMYKKKVKGREEAKLKSGDSLKAASVKEVRFSAKAELKDIKIKANNVRRLLERGYRVKCCALAGRGLDLSSSLSQISALIEDIAFVELGPKLEERQGYFIVRHIKFGPSKKGNKGSKGLTSISTNAEIQKESSTSSDGLVDCEEEVDAEESNFVPSVRPTLQPENRYAKKVRSIDKCLDEVKPPFQGPPVGPRQARGETSFGLFSGAKANDGNINPPSSGSDGGAASNDEKWGIFRGKK